MSTRHLIGHLKVCEGVIAWADEDGHSLLGYSFRSLEDIPFSDIYGDQPDADAPTVGALAVPARGAIGFPRATLRCPNGSSILVDLRGERMEDGCMLWTFSLTARGLRGERLDTLARHDALTRLPNRLPSLEELGKLALAREGDTHKLLAVCYLDIDRFRDINDSFGPVGGDAVLREVARRLKTAVPHDATVARVGGDEFALAVLFTQAAQCEALLEQVRARLAHPFRLQDRTARLNVSIGVALMPCGDQPTEVMLQHAQHAVFFAKRAGGAQVHYFDAELAVEQQEELVVRQGIQEGLRRGEFRLAYQPKVDMRCGRVIGVEALIRWEHPERGLLQPLSFVPLIEDHELVEQLGDWAIGEAVRQAAEWSDLGVQMSVSVNISPRHLVRPDFIQRLGAHLARHPQLHAGVLELEILETTAIKDFATVAPFIEACKRLAVPVMLDDFGTGYSSLTYLRQLPVSGLKLDQSFVRDMLDDPDDEAIVRGILLLAQAFGRKAVAEGVETVAHGRALMALGCTLGQGFGISKPMAPAALPAWVAAFEAEPLWGRAEDCPAA